VTLLRRLSISILSPRRPWLPVLLFVAVSLLTAHGLLESVDARLQIAFTLTPSPLLRGVWRVIGTLGSSLSSLLLMLLVLCLLQRRDRGLAAALLLAFMFGSLIELGLKHYLIHVNPHQLKGMPPLTVPGEALQSSVLGQFGLHPSRGKLSNSYPSGHMLRYFMLFAALALTVPRRPFVTVVAAAGLFVAAILLFTRAHWPTEVLGGALLGWSLVAAAVLAADLLYQRISPLLSPSDRVRAQPRLGQG
jgi:membrane-associated phospholipid phosphatase